MNRMISRERGRLSYPAGAIVTVFAKDIEDDAQLWEAEVDVQFKPVILTTFRDFVLLCLLCLTLTP